MNIKRIVLFALSFYVIVAVAVLVLGFLFGEPDPDVEPAQSLLQLNSTAQQNIAMRTNEKVEQVAKTSSNKKSPNKVKPPTSAPSSNTTVGTATNSTSNTTKTTTTSKTSTSTSTPKTTPKCGSGGTCTVAQVSTHNTQADCWVMYGGKVYDVTSYANSHPGGAGAFDSSTCGTDITSQLQGAASSTSLGGRKKNHPSSAYSDLANFYIADVSG